MDKNLQSVKKSSIQEHKRVQTTEGWKRSISKKKGVKVKAAPIPQPVKKTTKKKTQKK